MNQPAKDLAPTDDESGTTGIISVIERAAKDPNIDVQKMEKLLDMQERILEKQAEHEFWTAFAEMQTKLPVITEGGAIRHNGKLISKYARYDEDLHPVVTPILSEHGFSLLHQNVSSDTESVTIKSTLAHRAGHKIDTAFPLKADTSGSKSGPQAVASSRSYAKRYNTCDLLNIATAGSDDDAQSTKPRITEQQVADLESKLTEVGADKAAFLKFAKVEKLEDIHPNAYPALVKKLEAKAKQGAK